jgi:broad specificity phosphatase PhoE
MVQIFLVRHGQANSEAKDEVSYDKLSPLGKLQAGWLGQYFKKNEFNFDVVLVVHFCVKEILQIY